ncbi:MAG: protease pro-enzyme activation domain-containing protein [Acidimicrobiales bacterium]
MSEQPVQRPGETRRGDTVSGSAFKANLDIRSAGELTRVRRPIWFGRLVGVGAALLTCSPFLAMLPSAANAAPRSLSMVAVTAAPRVPAADSALGSVRAGSTETGLVVLRPTDEPGLTSFITAVTDKSSPFYHRYLAPGEFASRFGPASSTIAAVKAELTAEGLRVTKVSRDGLLVSFSGSAATVESAFRTELERYRLADGAIGQATTSAVHVPSAIAGSVIGVVGLDDLVHAHSSIVRPGPISVQRTFPSAKAVAFSHPAGSPDGCTLAQQDAEASGGLTDDEIANAYGAFGLYNEGDFGAGQHVAVFELQAFLATDIETFDACYFGASEAAKMSGTNGDLKGSRLSVIPVDGGDVTADPASNNGEPTLDIEDVSALAPQADIDVYEAPNTTTGSLDEYSQIVNSDVDQVVTSSWGVCEQQAQLGEPGTQAAENLLFEQAAAQGQTVLSAAGDTGDDNCNENRALSPPVGQNVLSVDDPAGQPYVLSVGGTTIDDATQPASEHTWDDGAQWGAGGGGISESWAMPAWQQPVADTPENANDIANAEAFETETKAVTAPFTTPTFCDGTLGLAAGTLCREEPDVTAEADEFTGAVTIYGKHPGYGNPNGWVTIGGTSSATPIWAALLALVNASPTCAPDKINGVPDAGFASPILYGIAANPTAYASSFNDIVSGNNDEYGVDNGLVFPAHVGYDMASGLGSPQLTTPTGGNALAFYMCDYAGQLAPPKLTGLSPSSGSTSGGYSVTVSGSGFGTPASPNVSGVEVGAAYATGVAVKSATRLTAIFPAALATLPTDSPTSGAGPAVVVVTLKNGESSFPGARAVFNYLDEKVSSSPIPTVTSIGPYAGLESSPSSVTIRGAGFTGATRVTFGGVTAPHFTVRSPDAITVTPPVFKTEACSPLPTKGVYKGENASNDICQVQVVVANAHGASTPSTILPPYEGAAHLDAMGVEILPKGYELAPQPSEFDYIPAPRITSVSTGTISDLRKYCAVANPVRCNAGQLASETGGLPANLVTLTGVGMNPMTLNYLTVGPPTKDTSVAYPVAATGTSLQLVAPAAFPRSHKPTVEPFSLAVGFASIVGASNERSIVYAGVPEVTKVVNAVTHEPGVPDSVACAGGPPSAGCGTKLRISGVGLLQVVGPIGFVDNVTGFSLGTQYSYAVRSDKAITTQAVAQNPAVADVEVCTVTDCSHDPETDFLFIYPPGNPSLDAMSPPKGPAQGGNTVVIEGTNLGCVVAVAFGKVVTDETANAKALLACGTTNEIAVIVPPGVAGTTVPVRLATVESVLDPSGRPSNSIAYSYTPSAPSEPTDVKATARPGTATVSWRPPASDGGSAVTGYTVTAVSPGRPSVRVTLPSSARSATYADLQANAPWSFAVRAVSTSGAGLAGVSNEVAPALGDDGYLVETSGGAVLGFGDVQSRGGIDGSGVRAVGMAATADGLGYLIVTSTGAVTAFGEATFLGEEALNNVTGIAAMPDGTGYWIVTSTGAVRAFGHAKTYRGSLPAGADVTGIASSPDGNGYWLVEKDGVVNAFGDAKSYGSLAGNISPSSRIVGIAVTPDGKGYWLASADANVYPFGDAVAHGSQPRPSRPIVAIAATPDGHGYWLVSADGTVYNFGTARNLGGTTNAVAIGL